MNWEYLSRLLDSLTLLGVDIERLPREFVFMAWEDKAKYIENTCGLHFCYRCKLPKHDNEMDYKYSTCHECAKSLHSNSRTDKRVVAMLQTAKLSEWLKPDKLRLAVSKTDAPSGGEPVSATQGMMHVLNRKLSDKK